MYIFKNLSNITFQKLFEGCHMLWSIPCDLLWWLSWHYLCTAVFSSETRCQNQDDGRQVGLQQHYQDRDGDQLRVAAAETTFAILPWLRVSYWSAQTLLDPYWSAQNWLERSQCLSYHVWNRINQFLILHKLTKFTGACQIHFLEFAYAS